MLRRGEFTNPSLTHIATERERQIYSAIYDERSEEHIALAMLSEAKPEPEQLQYEERVLELRVLRQTDLCSS